MGQIQPTTNQQGPMVFQNYFFAPRMSISVLTSVQLSTCDIVELDLRPDDVIQSRHRHWSGLIDVRYNDRE